jgi:uroporphyrinogen-III synthase
MRPLVILRPEPGATVTAERARTLGLEATKLPLFDVRPLTWAAPDPTQFDAILMTSANAARHGGTELDKLKALPVHAVGEATATAAREAGFTVIHTGSGGVSNLIAAIAKGDRLLHLAGRDHRETRATQTIAVYESAALSAPGKLDELGDAVIAVHSTRAGRRLAEILDERAGIRIAAIAAPAAEACGPGWERVEVAEVPTDEAVLALAARLCNTS